MNREGKEQFLGSGGEGGRGGFGGPILLVCGDETGALGDRGSNGRNNQQNKEGALPPSIILVKN